MTYLEGVEWKYRTSRRGGEFIELFRGDTRLGSVKVVREAKVIVEGSLLTLDEALVAKDLFFRAAYHAPGINDEDAHPLAELAEGFFRYGEGGDTDNATIYAFVPAEKRIELTSRLGEANGLEERVALVADNRVKS